MKARFFGILTILCAYLLVACDRQGHPIEEAGLDKLTKSVSTEADVRKVMGQPDAVWQEQDGTKTLSYPKGPAGARTWMFTISQDGKLKDYKQVLSDEHFANIKPGMTKEEVRHLLGKPRSIVQFKLKNEEVWEWLYLQSPNTPRLFNVHFDLGTGKVTQTSSFDEMH
jgi:outer membrane protein assembly factor BamE (lipoprotein component of BamABCDE complex)